MKTVLIITYYWPPASGPGVQRWLKMSKFLPEHGFKPLILTVKNGSYPSIDPSLLDEIPDDLQVVRTGTREPFEIFNRLRGKKGKEISVGLSGMKGSKSPVQNFGIWLRANFFIPDARKGWKPYAMKAAKALMSNVDLIITTGPPHSTHFIGEALNKRYNRPWLADFRDPWSTIHYHELMPMWSSSLRKHKKMEDRILRSANAVTVVSEGMKREFQDRRPGCKVIYNGFDQEDFKQRTSPDSKKLILSYIGNLKPNQDVPVLWKTLSKWLEENPMTKERFVLRLIGNKDASVLTSIHSYLPEANLEFIDQVSHADAVHAMQSSSVLLFIIPRSKGNGAILTGKLFEYLAAQRPIFSVGPVKGDAARILEDSGMPAMVDYEDSEQMRAQLDALFTTVGINSALPENTLSGIEKYSRKAQTRHLSLVLTQMLSTKA